MTPEEIPDELMAILDRHAGKTHSRTGGVAAALAEILTRYEQLIDEGDAAHPDGQTCRAVDVDGEPVSYRGDGEPLSERAREALTHVVRAARRLHDEEHADDPPALATVADAVRAEAGRRGMRGSQVAAELGVKHSVVVRLMQHSTALARWAGLDVAAVPREGT